MPEHEPLFDELLEKLHHFNNLGDKALSGELSQSGEEDQQIGTLHKYQQFFKEIVDKSKARTTKIEDLLPNFPNNKQEMSHPLAFYRELPRYMIESPPDWSIYYEQIQQAMREAGNIVTKLDKKYLMGYLDKFNRYVTYHVKDAGLEPPSDHEVLDLYHARQKLEDRSDWEPVSALKKLRQQNQS